MKKRILATMLVGAVAVTSVIGLSACGNSVSVPKGEQVTKEVWEEAFLKSLELKNYTLNVATSGNVTMKGTKKYSTDYTGSKFEEVDVDSTTKLSENDTYLYAESDQKYYSESTSSSNSKTTSDGETVTASSKSTSKSYYEFAEKGELNTDKYWVAKYSSSELKYSEYGKSVEEEYWRARKETSILPNAIDNIADIATDVYYVSADENAESGTIDELFDKFTYSSGVYTATLYYLDDTLTHIGITDRIECTVTISIKDKAVIGYSIKADVKNAKFKSKNYDKPDGVNLNSLVDLTYSLKMNRSASITNIGSTDVSKKATGDVKKAVDKAKADAEKAKNN